MAHPQQLVPVCGGFAIEPDNLALDRFLLGLARRPDPAVCFLPTASGEVEQRLASIPAVDSVA